MIFQEQIQKMHNGLWRVPLYQAIKLMPELRSVLLGLSSVCEKSLSDYIVDVKVHMLMPNQHPCIPNWHYDNIPRDESGKQDFSKQVEDKMYLWVSGSPLIQFKYPIDRTDSYGFIFSQEWIPFTQKDSHRGTASLQHTWRLFIRACPNTILTPNPPEKWLRRHSQVYLDSKTFSW